LPQGATNEYRYLIGDDGQVSPAEIERIKTQIGCAAVVCFGDRYACENEAPTYRFYPLRRGEVVDVFENGGRLFVKLRLEDFVCASSPKDYSAELYRLAARDEFHLLRYEARPENDKDGRYVYASEEESVLLDSLQKGDKAWLTTVQQLEGLTTFKEKLQGDAIFARAHLESRGEPVFYRSVKKTQMATLEKDDDLRLVVNYYFPSQSADTAARAVMKVIFPSGAQILAPSSYEIGMKESRIEIPIVFEPSSDKRYFSFDISFDRVTGGSTAIFGASESVLLRAKDAYWRQLIVWLAVMVYVIGSVVLVKENPLGGAILQGGALILMLKFAGKKVV
jgi:hypothetical protein